MSQTAEAVPAGPALSTLEPVAGPAVATGQARSLRQSVEQAVGTYFEQLDGQIVTDVYDLVLQEVEAPLLEVVLRYTRNNQTLAATVLGLNRGTLRKKLKRYGLL
jgi:Fis family transcriptional regulator